VEANESNFIVKIVEQNRYQRTEFRALERWNHRKSDWKLNSLY
jgi:hypothetical protein